MNRRRARILARTAAYYSERLREHGETARGVDWNSERSQMLRFDQLLRLVEPTAEEAFSLNDYGCGYGALVEHLARRELEVRYCGYDLSKEMIDSARQRYAGCDSCYFTTESNDLRAADFTVASGVFNVKQEVTDREWLRYLFDGLDRLHVLSTRGFAFNVLTLDSDPGRRERHLFYADPLTLLEHCRLRYSRWVALLQDYGLYEFTIIVRRDDNRKWPS